MNALHKINLIVIFCSIEATNLLNCCNILLKLCVLMLAAKSIVYLLDLCQIYLIFTIFQTKINKNILGHFLIIIILINLHPSISEKDTKQKSRNFLIKLYAPARLNETTRRLCIYILEKANGF